MKEIEGLAAPVPGNDQRHRDRRLPASRRRINDAFTIANRVLKAERRGLPPRRADDRQRQDLSRGLVLCRGERRVHADRAEGGAGARRQRSTRRAAGADGGAIKLSRPAASRCGTRPTGSMPSGWTRFLLERFEFPFTVVCGAGFDDTALRSKYDVIVMPSGAAFRAGWRRARRRRGGGGDAEPAGGGRRRGQSSDPDLRSLCQVTTGTGTGATRGSQRQEVRRGRRRRRRRRTVGAQRSPIAARPPGLGLPVERAARPAGARRSAPTSSTCPARCCASRSTPRRRRPRAPRITSTCSSTTARFPARAECRGSRASAR